MNSVPHAMGHRFGPDAQCSQCGVDWWAHRVGAAACPDPKGPEEMKTGALCVNGHEYDVVGVYWNPKGHRECRKCRQDREQTRAQVNPTHCKRGHELSAENVAVDSVGHRRCRTCRQATNLNRKSTWGGAAKARGIAG